MDKTTRKVIFDMVELLAKQGVKVVKNELNLRQKLESLLERLRKGSAAWNMFLRSVVMMRKNFCRR